MIKKLKYILKSYMPKRILILLLKQQEKKQMKKGLIVKQKVIQAYQKKYGYSIFVETGTYRGDMVEAQKGYFKNIISIELGSLLFEKAKKRFKNDNNVEIVHGDSGKILMKILKEINDPIIFWLDGHYSGGTTAMGDKVCPIFEELNAILSTKKLNHVILIDDARLFTGEKEYPAIDQLTEYIKSKNNQYQVSIENDIIRYVI